MTGVLNITPDLVDANLMVDAAGNDVIRRVFWHQNNRCDASYAEDVRGSVGWRIGNRMSLTTKVRKKRKNVTLPFVSFVLFVVE